MGSIRERIVLDFVNGNGVDLAQRAVLQPM
jgi:hypothetical protein